MEFIACFGQLLMGALFVIAAITDTRDYWPLLGLMQKKNIPMASILLPGAIGLKIVGGIAIVLNIYAAAAAFLLAGFVLIANVIFHPFWKYEGLDRKKEYTQFLTHLLVIAGLLLLVRV